MNQHNPIYVLWHICNSIGDFGPREQGTGVSLITQLLAFQMDISEFSIESVRLLMFRWKVKIESWLMIAREQYCYSVHWKSCRFSRKSWVGITWSDSCCHDFQVQQVTQRPQVSGQCTAQHWTGSSNSSVNPFGSFLLEKDLLHFPLPWNLVR